MPSSVLSSDSMHFGVLAAASHAAATSSRFKIFYNPRCTCPYSVSRNFSFKITLVKWKGWCAWHSCRLCEYSSKLCNNILAVEIVYLTSKSYLYVQNFVFLACTGLVNLKPLVACKFGRFYICWLFFKNLYRQSPSEFVIPLAKYQKALYNTQVTLGMRFRMAFETEESNVRKYEYQSSLSQ